GPAWADRVRGRSAGGSGGASPGLQAAVVKELGPGYLRQWRERHQSGNRCASSHAFPDCGRPAARCAYCPILRKMGRLGAGWPLLHRCEDGLDPGGREPVAEVLLVELLHPAIAIEEPLLETLDPMAAAPRRHKDKALADDLDPNVGVV